MCVTDCDGKTDSAQERQIGHVIAHIHGLCVTYAQFGNERLKPLTQIYRSCRGIKRGEEAVLNAASAQLTNFYDLPSGVAAGMSDSKFPDNQAGYEKGITTVLAGMAGANMVFESAGMLASLIGCSFEALVIDNDMLGSVQRAVRGIEVNDETLSYEILEQVCCGGPGHFLGQPQTLSIMETEYQYPALGDRATIEEWEETGSRTMRERAADATRAILSSHYPEYIDREAEKKIRDKYPILLPRDAMTAASARW